MDRIIMRKKDDFEENNKLIIYGKIIKHVRGLYYVKSDEIITCKASGAIRNEGLSPVVGDNVKLLISKEDKFGYIIEINKRKNLMIRPKVANIDQTLVVISLTKPKINRLLLDKFLLMCEYLNIKTTICINKIDLVLYDILKEFVTEYNKAGYKIILTSTIEGRGIKDVKKFLLNKTTALAGPSGVGKSSIVNIISDGNLKLETNVLSIKTQRGKHTTRHVELIEYNGMFILDTPGFSSLEVDFISNIDDLKNNFKEIHHYGLKCKYINCSHINETTCNVKDMVYKNVISEKRYSNYVYLFDEIKNRRKYK